MAFKVKAIYEYTSNHEDDLPFQIGQIITVTDEEDADWYGGEYIDEAGVKQEGIFPRNFVEKFEPTAPPRPQRVRTRKEPDAATEPTVTSPVSPQIPRPAPAADPEPEEEEAEEPKVPESGPVSVPVVPVPAAALAPLSPPVASSEAPVPRSAESEHLPSPPAPVPKAAPAQPRPKPAGPPPVSEKPTSNSFRDRIAAFNKPAAAPVTPFKPSGLGSGSSGFIKKPFVAPPPSKNAYVAPPRDVPVAKIYRRDEDPEIKEREAENFESAERAGLVPTRSNESAEGGEDEPKPLSLKERLALLQKQQAENASRHADVAAKKEKPKRPPKKRTDTDITEGSESTAAAPPALQRRDTEDTTGRASLDEPHPPRVPHPKRRTSSKDIEARDGNEADLSGAGDTTEGQEDLTEREDSDEKSRHVATAAKQDDEDLDEEEEVDEEDEEDDVDPEVRRKEELRARMARLGGGVGMAGLFGGPMMPMPGASAPPKKKKPAGERRSEDAGENTSQVTSAPPVPTPMALPGMSRIRSHEEPTAEVDVDEEESTPARTPHQESAPILAPRDLGGAPPVPGGRPAPPPVPTDARPPPPLPPSSAEVKSPSEGSESDDELSERTPQEPEPSVSRAPPPPPVAVPPPMPPTSPRSATAKRRSVTEEMSPASPNRPILTKRDSRPPPPIPGSAPALPPAQSRPPPPPPPGAPAPPLSRTTTGNSHAGAHRETEDEEVTEYEGDYDTDIASSVPHKDALKAHQRESSFEETTSVRSPVTDAPPSLPPPIPSSAPRAPPPIPSQPPPPPAQDHRKSVDFPRVAPPPPPPPKETPHYDDDDEYDPYKYTATTPGIPVIPGYSMPPPPPPPTRPPEPAYSPETPSYTSPTNPRGPPPALPPAAPSSRGPGRQSLDVQRQGQVRRSVDASRPSIESGFVANDLDLARQSGWWLQPNGLPPQLQGRKDIFFESEESTAANPQRPGRMTVARDVYILYQDYSQTVITVHFDPQDASDVRLEQRHEAPPRQPRQDQLEQSYERFGRAIGEAALSKKDSVVGDGTPQGFVYELLQPFKDALLPVGTRAYGALIYGNMANASTSQNDEIRPGDIISIRNAKFQGKHGAMHAKYSIEVGKPDHVGVVAEWDGTKKKVRAWEQGRESKKVKMESFKLDDLRSGEVKIWRVMPRSWIGWEGNN
ncbi:hypothetical protein GQ53DRAFT_634158 [Thozetella sp. PMI_491]|nr:hypothetical protein GQ53DRAFT_634158 [Thozetella sp. PMI_491]